LQFLRGDRAEVSTAGKILSQQPVEIFVAAALPRRIGIGKVDLGRQAMFDGCVLFAYLRCVVQTFLS